METLQPPLDPTGLGHVQALPEIDEPRRAQKFFIPSKNKDALLAYYCAIFGLIPGVGLMLGPVAFILGIRGVCKATIDPDARGGYHAIFSIAVGLIAAIVNWVVVAIGLVALLILF